LNYSAQGCIWQITTPWVVRDFFHLKADTHCLKWSKKEAGSLPQAEVECPFPRIFLFTFDLKMASFDAFLVVFCAI